MLTEGGPSLRRPFLAAGLLDELCFTIAPQRRRRQHPRPVGSAGTTAAVDLELHAVEQDGTLMGRWLVRR